MLQDKIILDIFVTESSEILHKALRHIAEIISLTAVMLFNDGGREVMSQELNYPARWEESFRNVLPLFHKDTVTVRFLGDVMMHQRQIENAYKGGKEYDFSSYFKYLEEDIRGADLAVANMEFTLGGEPYTGYPAFSAPDGIAGYMADCGVDIFLTANNHICDKGRAGTERTIGIYREMGSKHGISFTGIASDEDEREDNHPLIRVVKGIRIAFVNMTYATNGGKRTGWPKINYLDDQDDMETALEMAESKADVTIALPHWGEEYELLPSVEQRAKAGFLIEAGADLIIGAHPHVVQPIERISDVQTAYSLGNAVSNMSARNTRIGLMVTARIVRDGAGNISILELEPEFLWCSLPWNFAAEYTVLPVRDFIGRRDLWINKADYDNMVATYERVKEITEITD